MASNNRRTSMGARILKANATVDDTNLWSIGLAIALTLIIIHSLSYVTVEYGMYNNRNVYSQYTKQQMCLSELQKSKFDVYDTERYSEVMDDSTTFSLTETGTWVGSADIKEYVDFTTSHLFNMYDTTNDVEMQMILATHDSCSAIFTGTNRYQVDSKFHPPGGKCLESFFAYTLHWEVEPFKVKKINFFNPKQRMETLFNVDLNTDEVRDSICGIMKDNCQKTYELNNLTLSTCQSKYDSLPAIGEDSYLDGKTKGCRVIHSIFAAANPKHCPHLSFIPQEDIDGVIKCQKSKNQQLTDFFSQYEQDLIKQKGYELGFNDSLVEPCQYEDRVQTRTKLKAPKKLNLADTHPTDMFNDYQFQVYVAFIMYFTMLLGGLGLEYLVWMIMLKGEWDKNKENKWKVAQFVFPLLAATSLGLASTHNYLAIPITVVTCFKLGFPEVIMLYYMALYEKSHSLRERVVDFIIGMGTIVHHSSSMLYIALLVTHVLPINRYTIGSTLPLVAQHWIVLLKYNYKLLYIVFETILEMWWEWTAFSVLEIVHEYHWTGGVAIFSMLFAHWCYFGGGFLALFVTKAEEDGKDDGELLGGRLETVGNDINRFNKSMRKINENGSYGHI